MLNQCVIMGRLTAAPELKSTANGISVTNITVAVDRNTKDKDGGKQTDFIPVIAWRQTAEFISKYFSKGKMICVSGELQSRSYNDKNGDKRTAFEIVAQQVNFCGDSKDKADQKDEPYNPYQQTEDKTEKKFEVIDNSDELPF